ncbi:hypothetical protein C474_19639 [Halogeometricum pallidum JCM 14848]|uniref:Uncharacterized protein n=1 Tax=Halogeometricum pallidum JCM 14848 TaxID=1227487 RepID=M0CWY1_HALPD|nr:hypothetical protein C474_19639 [Halogeometricum pallidum JCM 14848]
MVFIDSSVLQFHCRDVVLVTGLNERFFSVANHQDSYIGIYILEKSFIQRESGLPVCKSILNPPYYVD